MKRGRVKPRNSTRKVKAWARNFGEESALVRLMPCAVAGPTTCFGPIEVAHHPSRGASGGRFDIGPLCKGHHLEQGAGVDSFEAKHRVDLRELWDDIALGHSAPLGLVGLASEWRSYEFLSYEHCAIFSWVRRSHHRGLGVNDIASALDIDQADAARLVELAV